MINLKANKDAWVMFTDGTGVFNYYEIKQNQHISLQTPGIFPIFAHTKSDLFDLVFENPEFMDSNSSNEVVRPVARHDLLSYKCRDHSASFCEVIEFGV